MRKVLLLSMLLPIYQAMADDRPELVFKSGTNQVQVLEVYSSQGCSSCPPAEKWIGALVNDENLWRKMIPMVFHVDYWDYLGWKDPFSEQAFSVRQGDFKKQGLSRAVYTPGFMLNGREWRGWFQGKSIPQLARPTGELTVRLNGDDISAEFSEFEQGQRLNIAILGFGIETQIKSGENRHKTLRQEFVVLSHKQVDSINNKWITDWQLPDDPASRYALSAWVTRGDSLQPIQATGGWLPMSMLSPLHYAF